MQHSYGTARVKESEAILQRQKKQEISTLNGSDEEEDTIKKRRNSTSHTPQGVWNLPVVNLS